MLPFFARKVVVLHKAGREMAQGFYNGFCIEVRPDLMVAPNNWQVCKDYDEMFTACMNMFSLTKQGMTTVHKNKIAGQ